MLNLNRSEGRIRLDEVQTEGAAEAPRELALEELAVVTGAIWRPSWTAPRNPDDIFRDDG